MSYFTLPTICRSCLLSCERILRYRTTLLSASLLLLFFCVFLISSLQYFLNLILKQVLASNSRLSYVLLSADIVVVWCWLVCQTGNLVNYTQHFFWNFFELFLYCYSVKNAVCLFLWVKLSFLVFLVEVDVYGAELLLATPR